MALSISLPSTRGDRPRQSPFSQALSSDHASPEKNNSLIFGHGFDVGSLPLHHFSALLQVFRPVIGRTDLVSLDMGELALDDIRPEAGLVQDGARQCPETVHGSALVVTEPVEGVKEGILGDWLSLVSLRRKEQIELAGQWPYSSMTARACEDKGTMCGDRIFIRSAGMRHSP